MNRDWLLRTHGLLIGTLLAYAVGFRLLPWVLRNWGVPVDLGVAVYPWNFSPLPALFLFTAACFRDLRWVFLLPLGACVAGDLGIWALSGRMDYALYPGLALVYAGHAITISLGIWLRKQRGVAPLVGAGLLAECVFFLVTNFGVWWFSGSMNEVPLYAPTATGLLECYIAALPYFKNSLISMAVFGGLLFGPLLLASRMREREFAAE
ncbi:MAG: DUF6580 family putative transport protein [Planctomycetaceae bacterium]